MSAETRKWYRRHAQAIREIRRWVVYPSLLLYASIAIWIWATATQGPGGCTSQDSTLTLHDPFVYAYSHVSPYQGTPTTNGPLGPRAYHSYAEKAFLYGNDPSKRTVYFILQAHATPLDVSPHLFRESVRAAARSQVSVYRIVERLHAQASIDVVGVEGCSWANTAERPDDDNPKDPKRVPTADDIRVSCGTGGVRPAAFDAELEAYLGTRHTSGALLLASSHEDLYAVGYEERAKLEWGLQVVRSENWLAGRIGLDTDGVGFEDKYEATRTARAMVMKERSACAFRHTLEAADWLYGLGRIRNNNAAIVIGAGHFVDYYQAIVREIKQGRPSSFNAVFVFTRDTLGYGELPKDAGDEKVYEVLKSQDWGEL